LEELRRQHAKLLEAGKTLQSDTVELEKAITAVGAQRAETQRAVAIAAEISKQLEASRRVWKPPTKVGGSLVDAFREKVDLASRITTLRPTLSGSFHLEAAREEHQKSMAAGSPTRMASQPILLRPVEGCEQMASGDLHTYERLFKLADKSGRGSIDSDELHELMRSLGKRVSKEEIDALVQELDTDGNGTIEFKEFLQGMDHLNEFFVRQLNLGTSTPDSTTPSASSPVLQPQPPLSPLPSPL
jgi:hypothetical protein